MLFTIGHVYTVENMQIYLRQAEKNWRKDDLSIEKIILLEKIILQGSSLLWDQSQLFLK